MVSTIAVLTLAILYYVATHFSLDTNTMNMLDPTLPFRIHDRELEQTFPQLDDLIVVVVEGQSNRHVHDAADTLVETLRQEPTLFRSIYHPGGGPFFAKHGLLYLDTEELWQLDEQLTEAAPFIGTLAEDPSLHGLFGVLGRSVDEDLTPEHQATLIRIFDGIGDTIEAQLAGLPDESSWHEQMLDLTESNEDVHRSFVLIQPQLDYSNLQAGQDAIGTIRQAAQQLEETTSHPIRIRLTGSVAIADDELGSSLQGAAYATLGSFGLVWILLLFGLRSFRLVIAILLVLFTGLVWTTALAIATIGHLNIISITFPVLYIGLGVDFGIQFAMRYREEIRRGLGHHECLAWCGARNRGSTHIGCGFSRREFSLLCVDELHRSSRKWALLLALECLWPYSITSRCFPPF